MADGLTPAAAPAATDAAFWTTLSAPVGEHVIRWRQDGRPFERDRKFFARFVPFVNAGVVRRRLDEVAPGQWHLDLEALPTAIDPNGEVTAQPYAFRATLTVRGCRRSDVGMGKDYKSAATDAFKRAAVRFGIAHEIADLPAVLVPMDSDGRFARPTVAPAVVYAELLARHARGEARDDREARESRSEPETTRPPKGAPARAPTAPNSDASEEPACPKCGGRMWDNRLSKRSPTAPDYKCRDKRCDGVVWPPKPNAAP